MAGNASFESAVARAKMLAAKLSQQAPGGGGGGGGGGGLSGPGPGVCPPGFGGPPKRSYDEDEDDNPSKRPCPNDPFGAQLAAMKEQSGNGNGGGGGQRGAGSVSNTPHVQGIVMNGEKTLDMMVPGSKVGYIIGKGGEMIRNLQERAGVKMTVFQQTSDASDAPKQLRIVGEPDKVDYAKELVNDLLTEKELESLKMRTNKIDGPRGGMGGGMGGGGGGMGGGGPMGGMGQNDYGSSRAGTQEIPVPAQFVGLVIGKGGESIKRIQAETGCKVQFDTSKTDDKGNTVCQISGPMDCQRRAEDLIKEIIENATNHKKNKMRDGEEVRMSVPANRTGAVIGRGGETIRQIKQQCGCDIELDKNAKVGPGDDKTFIIRGPADRIPYAQQLINEKVYGTGTNENENAYGAQSGDYSWPANYFQQQEQQQQPSNQPSESGPDATAQWAAYYAQYYANGGAQAQQSAAPAQPAAGGGDNADYSAQWAEYYRAYGMHKEAEMIEQMAKQGGQAPGQSSSGAGGPPNDRPGDNKPNAAPVAYPGYNNYGGYGGDKH